MAAGLRSEAGREFSNEARNIAMAEKLKDYIVLLRGINVGGSKRLKMEELRQMLVEMDFLDVKTYIQSGNIVLKSEKSEHEISKRIQEKLKVEKDYDVPVLTVSLADWQRLINENPFAEEDFKYLSVTICDKTINPEELAEAINFDLKHNRYEVIGNRLYQITPDGYRNTKLTNNWIENKLKLKATTRNWKTTLKMAEMANA